MYSDGLNCFDNKSIQPHKTKNDFTVNISFICSMALINSTVKYRDLGGSGTVKIWCTVHRETVKTAHPYSTGAVRKDDEYCATLFYCL